METGKEKNHNVSLSDKRKETFKKRLLSIMEGMSIRHAAEKWGVPISTINNYLYRGSTPRLNVIGKIAGIEGISTDWLLAISDDTQQETQCKDNHLKATISDEVQQWLDIIMSLNLDERVSILHVLKREGTKILLKLLNEENIELINSIEIKKKLDLSKQVSINETTVNLHEAIAKLPIRGSLKELIILALNTNGEADKEVCAIMMNHKEATQPDNHTANKKSGTR